MVAQMLNPYQWNILFWKSPYLVAVVFLDVVVFFVVFAAVLVAAVLVAVDFVAVFLVVVFSVAVEADLVLLLVLLLDLDLAANIDSASSTVSPSTVCSLVSDTFILPCFT